MAIIVNSGDSGDSNIFNVNPGASPPTSSSGLLTASAATNASTSSIVPPTPPSPTPSPPTSSSGSALTPQVSGSTSGETTTATQATGNNFPGGSVVAQSTDMRVRLAALNPPDIFIDKSSSSILYPLSNIGGNVGAGILFPYTPSIAYSQSVSYMDLQLVHSDTDYAAYTRSSSVTISITGKFTVQSQREGLYALACLHFLRIASKSYFGETDKLSGKAGLPPPILVLDGYGNYMLNQLRVILKSHSWTFDDSADGVTITIPGGGFARLPALFSITCELVVVQTPQRMRKEFSFGAFATGALMNGGKVGWI